MVGSTAYCLKKLYLRTIQPDTAMKMHTMNKRRLHFCQSRSCRACTDETILSGMCV